MITPGAPDAQIHDLTPVDGHINENRDPAVTFEAVLVARERARAARWRARMVVWGPVIAAVVGGGTWAGVEFSAPRAGVAPSEITEDVQKLEEKATENTRKIRALGKVTVEGLDHLGRKIDAVHPGIAPIEKPPSLVAAEAEVESDRVAGTVDRILGVDGVP